MNTILFFAATEKAEATASGIGALGLNVQGFLFQLITFVMVLLLLRKFVYGKLVATLEARRAAVIESLDSAKEAAIELQKTNERTAELLKEAQKEAAGIVALAHTEASSVIEEAETKAGKKAEHLIASAEARLEQDIAAARKQLRTDVLGLVTKATEQILQAKVDSAADAKLIEKAVKELS